MAERPILFSGPMVRALLDGTKTQTRRVARPKRSIEPMTDECPYGAPGDRLWVRETFAIYANGSVVYRASAEGLDPRSEQVLCARWLPSIHMPRAASRLTLEITDVRVERLQKISEADAEAEGVAFMRKHPDIDETLTASQLYAALWDSINEKRGYGWDANPWVWVVSFKVVRASA